MNCLGHSGNLKINKQFMPQLSNTKKSQHSVILLLKIKKSAYLYAKITL